MNKSLLLASLVAVAALAACSKPADTTPAAADAASSAASSSAMAASAADTSASAAMSVRFVGRRRRFVGRHRRDGRCLVGRHRRDDRRFGRQQVISGPALPRSAASRDLKAAFGRLFCVRLAERKLNPCRRSAGLRTCQWAHGEGLTPAPRSAASRRAKKSRPKAASCRVAGAALLQLVDQQRHDALRVLAVVRLALVVEHRDGGGVARRLDRDAVLADRRRAALAEPRRDLREEARLLLARLPWRRRSARSTGPARGRGPRR